MTGARAWAALAVACLAASPGAAGAQGVSHRVEKGETAASISKAYYGTARHGRLVSLANGKTPSDKLWVGSEVVIPTARPYIVQRRSSYEELARRLLGHKRRWTAFRQLNQKASRRRRVSRGQQVWVPHVFTHEVTRGQSWRSISALFYGSRRGARNLARYNLSEGRRPRPGSSVLVPAGNLHLSSAALVRLINHRILGLRQAGTPAVGVGRLPLVQARKLLRDGEFAAVAVELVRQLAPLLTSARDRADVFRLLGTAMVALDRPTLARACFSEMLRHQPDLKLDARTTSPKVKEAVRKASARDPR